MQFILSKQIEPTLAFHLMKFAFQAFEKEVIELTPEEYAEAYQQAYHQITLHEQILLSEAACGVVIPDKLIQTIFRSIQTEHGGEENFFLHLQKNNLRPDEFFTVLGNDLKVETILARVAYYAPPVSHQEIQDYYNSHQGSFFFPEQRSARHILISTENRYSHLPKDALLYRTMRIHSRLQNKQKGMDDQASEPEARLRVPLPPKIVEERPQSFIREAQLHSDCTTASDGGDLGRISPGELCPTLDHALFQLAAGEISPIIQTTQGFHILFCEAIHPGQRLNFQEAAPQIHQILTREARIDACRIWLRSLFPINTHNLK
ncbi:MAG: peptidylprolyl isomerase [Deltaproteobacteria bacterium]|nr:peptidylprolyl isomerase [Deltaproteobacteria bacterium]